MIMVISAPRFLFRPKYNAIALFPFILIRKGTHITPQLLNHERIHLRQQVELLVIPFYLLYLAEFIVRSIRYRSSFKAYLNISFEREAYTNDNDLCYLAKRKFWSSFRYL